MPLAVEEEATVGKGSVAVVVGALAAVLVLASGCAIGGSPSTVAYVGDSRITQRELDAALTGVQQALGPDEPVATEAVVDVLIHGVIADQIAAQRQVTVTDSQRDALLVESNLAPLLDVPAAKEVAYDVADQQLVGQAVGPQAYLQDVQAIDVELNPRFGVLDPAQKRIIQGQSSSLSLPGTP